MSIEKRNRGGVPYLFSVQMESAGGVAHGFSTRQGGVSTGIFDSLNLGVSRGDDPDHVRENYHRFLAAVGAPDSLLAACNQVHGTEIRNLTTADLKHDPYDKTPLDADGILTAIPGVTLTVFSADCIPVLLYDPKRRVIAALHAGWRGTAAGIVTAAVEQMTALYGTDPSDILAAIGPGIDKCCFETHEDVPNAMTSALASESLPFIDLLENGKFTVDLKGINARRLELAGVDPTHIDLCRDCTCCQEELYWSHRRQGTQRGSMASVITLL